MDNLLKATSLDFETEVDTTQVSRRSSHPDVPLGEVLRPGNAARGLRLVVIA
jgi:hypothetical protein